MSLGTKSSEPKEKLFIMMGNAEEIPAVFGSVKASSPKEAIEKSLDPDAATMYIPTHMQNQKEYGTLPDEEVRAIALRESLHYYSLDGGDPKQYKREFMMLEVDLETGSVTEH